MRKPSSVSREVRRGYERKYYWAHQKEVQKRHREYYRENREHVIARTCKNAKSRRENDPEVRGVKAENKRLRYASDPEFRLMCNVRTRIRDALRGRPKSFRTLDILGISPRGYLLYLENNFIPDMPWANYGASWQIHHVNPLEWFDLTNPTEQKLAFHYANTKPLFTKDHTEEHRRLDKLYARIEETHMATEATVTAEAPNGLDNPPEFPAVTEACPPGTNPAPAKPTKAVSKTYYVVRGMSEDLSGDSFPIVSGSGLGFRTKEEVNRFVRELEPGEYTLVAAFTKKIVVSDVRRVKGV